MQLTEEQIRLIQNYFEDKPVVKAYLFGSYVRGEAMEDSDIDLLVELDYSKRIGLGFISMQDELGDLIRKKIDLVSKKSISKHILPIVEKQKMLIYEKR